MSELKDKFHLKQNLELVSILESEDAYTPFAKQCAAEVLQERFLEEEDLKQLATEIWEENIKQSFRKFLKMGMPPKSYFLTENELKAIFIKQFEAYKERKELLSVDSTKYWYAF